MIIFLKKLFNFAEMISAITIFQMYRSSTRIPSFEANYLKNIIIDCSANMSLKSILLEPEIEEINF